MSTVKKNNEKSQSVMIFESVGAEGIHRGTTTMLVIMWHHQNYGKMYIFIIFSLHSYFLRYEYKQLLKKTLKI